MSLRCLRGLLQHEELLLGQVGQATSPWGHGHLGQLWAGTARLHVYRQLVLLHTAQLGQALTKTSSVHIKSILIWFCQALACNLASRY